jgi:hypothetical protein
MSFSHSRRLNERAIEQNAPASAKPLEVLVHLQPQRQTHHFEEIRDVPRPRAVTLPAPKISSEAVVTPDGFTFTLLVIIDRSNVVTSSVAALAAEQFQLLRDWFIKVEFWPDPAAHAT